MTPHETLSPFTLILETPRNRFILIKETPGIICLHQSLQR